MDIVRPFIVTFINLFSYIGNYCYKIEDERKQNYVMYKSRYYLSTILCSTFVSQIGIHEFLL